jgi:hypothetical protein
MLIDDVGSDSVNEGKGDNMVEVLTGALVIVPAAAMAAQYRNYRMTHPKGREEECDCKN